METNQTKRYPWYYDLPLWSGIVALGLHTLWLYVMAANSTLIPKELGPILTLVTGVGAMGLFSGALWVFTKERITWAIWASGIGHSVVIGAHFAHGIWPKEAWIIPGAGLLVFAVLLPVLMKQYANLRDKYEPGGRSMSDWETDLSRVSATLFRLEQEQRQAKDKEATAKDTVETALRQELDTLRGELGKLHAIEANRTKMREAKAAQRAKGEPGPAIENDSKLALFEQKDSE